jgi:hypothetical protein
MAGVFQNIDPPFPSPPGECVPPAFGAGGGHTRWLERGCVGVNILEDVRPLSVLYVCKYFVTTQVSLLLDGQILLNTRLNSSASPTSPRPANYSTAAHPSVIVVSSEMFTLLNLFARTRSYKKDDAPLLNLIGASSCC